jgi:transcription elongation factor GreA
MANGKPDYMTATQKAALEAELAELEGPKRAEVVKAIATARGFGDLSENFEYHAAKNEQGLLERKITILRSRLASATLLDEEAAAASGRVEVGSLVELEDEHGDRMEVEISALGNAGAVSPDSPLGTALVGAAEGDVVDVAAPRGSWKARVLSIRRA